MRESPQQTLARLERELPARRRQQARIRSRLIAVRRRIRKVRAGIMRRKVDERERAVQWALRQVGTTENPPGSNSGPKIDTWIRAGGGVPGWSWCQYFVNAVATHGGCPQLPTGYTVYVMQGKYAKLGFEPIDISAARGGDMVFFKFPGVSNDPCDHVGIRLEPLRSERTVEGNTSAGSSGSQSNGGGVFVRDDHMPFAVGAVRVPYES